LNLLKLATGATAHLRATAPQVMRGNAGNSRADPKRQSEDPEGVGGGRRNAKNRWILHSAKKAPKSQLNEVSERTAGHGLLTQASGKTLRLSRDVSA
jgi:hypothetical protein